MADTGRAKGGRAKGAFLLLAVIYGIWIRIERDRVTLNIHPVCLCLVKQ